MINLSDIQGHWVRDWIKAPGFEDHTTCVHWMQAGLDYADVRIPLERPALGAALSLADLGAAALLELAQAEGFAGHVALDGETCTWHREVNWHGTPDAPDVGAISFDAKGRMIEAGVLADYTELWAQHAQAETTVQRFGDGTYSGLLVQSGEIGVVGLGQPTKPATGPIVAALQSGTVSDAVDQLFDGLHALCHVAGRTVTATLATNPFVENTPILTLGTDTVTWHRTGFDGAQTDMTLQTETVLA